MSIKPCFLFIFCLVGPFVWAQKQANVWHFGNGRKLDFSTGVPVAGTGPLVAYEGTCSYSDDKGNLLFYTDGTDKIWNAANQVMYTLQGTGGGASSMQTSVAFEAPGEPCVYYLFTMEQVEEYPAGRGLRYFKIDMTQNNGLGAVTQPYSQVHTPSFEGLCAIRHSNKRDFWILIHQGSDGLGVYKVNASGVSLHSVFPVSNMGTKGMIKASPDGFHVITKPTENDPFQPYTPTALLLGFDPATGQLSNSETLTLPENNARFEFSPDSRWVFLPTSDEIIRYDLLATPVSSSGISIFGNLNFNGGACDTQLGPDGNIYMVFVDNLLSGVSNVYLHRIRCPNNTNPIYEPNVLFYPGPSTNYVEFIGLPSFPAYIFRNTQPTFVSLGPDTLFLSDYTGPITLNAQNPGASYLWSNGATTQTISVNTLGTYSVTVTGPCGSGTDQVVVANTISNIVAVGDSCGGSPYTFSILSNRPTELVQWNFGDNSSSTNTSNQPIATHTFSGPGTYTVKAVINQNCKLDTLQTLVTISSCVDTGFIEIKLQGDSCVQTFKTFSLYSNLTIQQVFEWNFGDPLSGSANLSNGLTANHTFSSAGTYTVRCIAEINCSPPVSILNPITFPCFNVDTVYLEVTIAPCEVPEPECFVYFANSFTPNDDARNNVFGPVTECNFEVFDFTIFNRWGEAIYTTTDPTAPWSGMDGTAPAPSGIYAYSFNYKLPKKSFQFTHGFVNLMR